MFYSSLEPAYDVCRVRRLVQPDYLKSGACVLLPGAAVLGLDADERCVTVAGQLFRRESHELVQLGERRFDRGLWASEL